MSKKLLIVDDETELTDGLKQYFEIKGFIVFTVPTGEEAITLLSNEKPDIIVLDMLLKGKLDGVDVLKEAKKLSASSKVIMLTGSDTVAKEQEVMKIGVCRYLRKPIMIKELHNIINEVLEEDNIK